MLTSTQQQILDDLQKEFMKLNEKPISNTLLPISEIFEERNQDIARRKAIELANNEYNAIKNDTMQRDFDRLSSELENTSITLELTNRGIRMSKYRGECIDIYYRLRRTYIGFPSRIESIDACDGRIEVSFYATEHSEARFDSLDELVKHPSFVYKLKTLI